MDTRQKLPGCLMRLGVLLAGVVAVTGVATAQEDGRKSPGVGEPAPDFTLLSTTGEQIRLSQFRGKQLVLLEFYGVDFACAYVETERREQIMPDVIAEVTTEFLQAFADAWNRHDVDALMSFMTEGCVFEASAGPDVCGTRYTGREAVRAGFAEVWATFPDAHWGNARHVVCGKQGVSEWTFTGTRADGTRVEVHGCDLFTFRDGKIALKNSYRKNRPPLGPPKR